MDVVSKVAKLDPKKKYIFFVNFPTRMKDDNVQVCINKLELAIKNMGIKDIKVLPHQASVFEVA